MVDQLESLEALDTIIATRLRKNLRRLRGLARTSFQPRRLPDPREWAPEKIWLNPEMEAGAGPLDLDRRPWWREPLTCIADSAVRRVINPASTQVGKTLNLIVVLLYLAENMPAPAMVVLPTQQAAEELRDRVYGIARRSKLSRVTVPPERLWNNKHIQLGTMRVYLAWSGSKQRLRGRPCKYVFLSEIDVYDTGSRTSGDPVAAAEQRVKAFHASLIWMESSPSESPSRIWQHREAASDQRIWVCPCDECGAYQELRFFPYSSGKHEGCGGVVGYHKDASPEECRRKAKYKCIHGCELTNSQVRRMKTRGMWISRGYQRVEKDGTMVGDRPADRTTVSYHLWAIHSTVTTLGELAAQWALARDAGKLAEFFGNWLGLSFERRGKLASWKSVNKRLSSHFPRKIVPPNVWFLTAGSDVQEDRVYWVVRGWGPWMVSYLIDWGEFLRTPTDGHQPLKSDLLKLNTILGARWSVTPGMLSPTGKDSHRIRLLCIDSNYRGKGVVSRVVDVNEWMRSLPERWRTGRTERVRAIRGDSTKKSGDVRATPSLLQSSQRTGEVYRGGLTQWQLNVQHYYPVVLGRLKGSPNERGSFHVCNDMLEHEDGKKYLRQLCNFGPRTKRMPDGMETMTWSRRDDRLGNDFFDCEIYDAAAADMVVGPSADAWTEEHFDRMFRPQPSRRRPNRERPDRTDER